MERWNGAWNRWNGTRWNGTRETVKRCQRISGTVERAGTVPEDHWNGGWNRWNRETVPEDQWNGGTRWWNALERCQRIAGTVPLERR